MSKPWKITFIVLLIIGSLVSAQEFYRRSGRGYRNRPQRQMGDRNGVPLWENDKALKHDVFTFVRIRYNTDGRQGWRGEHKWRTDYPDADLNLSYRLQELTSIKTDPHGKILELTDPELFEHPFIYMIEPGALYFSESEVVALRDYLYRGGFLMVDDFWGEREWANFEEQIRRVFPNRPIEELPLEHEIFHMVYDLKEKPLIPSVHAYLGGMATERWDADEPHYRGIQDDEGRLMAIICHNTDLGDGWEREGMDQGYFKEYSERWAYPMGINIVTYALTH